MKTVAIITAGGCGKRLPGECKKQFRNIAGKPVLAYAIDSFYNHPMISSIVITVPAADIEESITLLTPLYPQADITIVEGGITRQESVFKALNIQSQDTDFVIIHDGVRPFVKHNEISTMLNMCMKYNAVIPVHKVKNTIKEVSEMQVIKTIPRESLVEVYTPQIFKYELIKKYHQMASQDGFDFTDDAAILEYYGSPVHIHFTEKPDIKVTDIHDFEITQLLIEKKLQEDK